MQTMKRSLTRPFSSLFVRLVAGPVSALLIGLLIILSLSAALLLLLADAHQDIDSHARDDADRLALMVEREVSRNVDLIDLSIQGVADGVEQPPLMHLPLALRDQTLFSRAAAARYIRNVSVFDANGKLIANSLDADQTLDAAFLNPFVAARRENANAAGGLVVGHPYLAKDRITRLVTFSRSVRTPDGKFDGVVIATVNLNYFSEVLLDLHLGHWTVINVSLSDGTELIRTLEPEYLSQSDGLAQRLGNKWVLWLTHAIAPSTADQVIRAQRPVAGTPMVVTVNLPASEVFADWVRRCTQVALLCVLVSLVFAVLLVFLAHTLRMRARSEAAVEHLATTDALTELHNRRAFDQTYTQEFERIRALGASISVLFVDVDNFKLYNDHYGHVAGDRALQAVARALRSCVKRSSDFVCRYGGEEFVVVLPDNDRAAAMAMAEKIRMTVHQLALAHAATEIGFLTCSIGIATVDGADPLYSENLLENADRALYAAKRAGRNRAVHFDSIIPAAKRDHSSLAPLPAGETGTY
jgi:diguanylate cyclase (GGDEF)-like protein